MDLLSEVRKLLKQYDIKPKKRLSQNFVVCSNLIFKIIDCANIESSDIVLEIGAGLGFLTKRIAEKARKVIAVEIDGKLVNVLRSLLKDFNNVEIIQADIMKLGPINVDKIISNVPFNISSPLLFKIAKEYHFNKAVLTLQKEFVDRMLAKPGSRDYGRLSVTSNFFFSIEFIDKVPRVCFYPPPKVDVSLIRISMNRSTPLNPLDEFFLELTRFIFTQRNRKLKNVLPKFFEVIKIPKDMWNKILSGISLQEIRVIDLSVNDVYEISSYVYKYVETLRRGD
ncbi:MAG: 16S rRNA (adenine(1518)-N(6)/adenine(1519)-N(6))-dimethyltransferase RsmA [Candidatus Methanomethylicia archaeon]